MAGPLTITQSGALYDMQHSIRKRARPLDSGGWRPKVTAPSFRGPRLLRVLGWLERFSPPKVLLIVAADAQLKNPIIFSETKDTARVGSSDGASDHANIVRVVRKIRRVPLVK